MHGSTYHSPLLASRGSRCLRKHSRRCALQPQCTSSFRPRCRTRSGKAEAVGGESSGHALVRLQRRVRRTICVQLGTERSVMGILHFLFPVHLPSSLRHWPNPICRGDSLTVRRRPREPISLPSWSEVLVDDASELVIFGHPLAKGPGLA